MCVKKADKVYAGASGSKNVLICWEHGPGELTKTTSELGVCSALQRPATAYPDASSNLIWTVQDQAW
ncbi:hypothetical protein FIBSPDRAFT_560775 [Athelia psychrophila]|uniref:Uncharacterized protein n=1 Tax=Athelia psychrophila TaxID=1759441 RepID=A0A167TC97_9AGAM|nr:hypothetical protein FIBSPDRAFT_571458 [Fibularhizoctonia sp. CBS 109695]KZP02786.1 hypothetical protein FIBSPDRAFT_560775 [Fibularhizoctonia sp. CBS 109695]